MVCQDVVDLIRQRFFTLKDFSGQGRAYFSDDFDFEEAAVSKNLRKDPRLRELLPAWLTDLKKRIRSRRKTLKPRSASLQKKQVSRRAC